MYVLTASRGTLGGHRGVWGYSFGAIYVLQRVSFTYDQQRSVCCDTQKNRNAHHQSVRYLMYHDLHSAKLYITGRA